MIIFLICFIVLNVKANNFDDKWLNSQVFIYHDDSEDIHMKSPDCFGNLISENQVLTAASCFIDMEKLLKHLETKNYMISEANLLNQIRNSFRRNINIENTIIAKVGMENCFYFLK